ncbi:patatin-like phospholipase family protein [Mycobacterium sp. CBMA293]|uniref:patatin-like phospholipase family protein n=1 Tax=unclassified Mycolicibacterium TaxID=2636767 RepID=UPI0012DF5396|nr:MULTISPECIES: patatin-like phospholipase family protein [unclassified Mycolicibacterium]MUL45768.1 patatin-like phospholipase family protein [Mycolicibacterium sp. CBMA 360]MUL60439.1 patatin-like phospholipase family protein [Mycolicibacterium sp. CBMA 335]MUL72254.1 patatin-like phospholipase family protein [Mycolicibacterium sp. CBMA 311]MUL95345.1 patatin-like phospholipase family protein [Mycolicibacterium sp. CBMA 230]MUM06834.1 patatin [Mycolicibacterium sp. CBMA 213]
MTKRALVLAGGGIAGIAWETGILQGIADEAPEIALALRNSDVVLGTSAGSAVGAQLGSALTIAELFERQVGAESPEISPGIKIDVVMELFVEAMLATNGTRSQQLQRLGAAAAAADTVNPAVRRNVIERRLPSHEWPAHDLRITGVDIDSGELVIFNRESGVSLVDAVEASCAVPAAWPIVTIGGQRFMDGGMGSSVNMIAVADCDTAVVLVPAPSDSPSPFGAGPGADVRSFAGNACAIFADDESLAAFGVDPLDPACRIPSAHAGRVQGRRVAAEVAAFLA